MHVRWKTATIANEFQQTKCFSHVYNNIVVVIIINISVMVMSWDMVAPWLRR